MDPAWVVACVAVVGILLQVWVGARNAGARAEKVRAHGFRIKDLEEADKAQNQKLAEHGERIAKVEARCAAVRGPECE